MGEEDGGRREGRGEGEKELRRESEGREKKGGRREEREKEERKEGSVVFKGRFSVCKQNEL